MEQYNLLAAWIGILLGFIAGAIPGLFFYRDDWLGGYASWPRRLIRLAHISFFGLGFINLGYALTVRSIDDLHASPVESVALIIGAVTMPVVCYLAAWRKPFRHLFPIPVTSLFIGVIVFINKGFLS
jgi:hypothetical protein